MIKLVGERLDTVRDARVRVVVEEQLHDLKVEVRVLAQSHRHYRSFEHSVSAPIRTHVERHAMLDEQLSEFEVAKLGETGSKCERRKKSN